MATVGFGDFEWDDDMARSNFAKHGVSFEEAASVFLDSDYLLKDDPSHLIASLPSGFPALHASCSWFTSSADPEIESLVPDVPPAPRERPMKEENATQAEPSDESLAEMPEVDFSRAVRPNRFAALRGEFKQAVFLDKALWDHFGTEERVLEALRMLVSLAERSSRSVA